ncbi:hypothetical protein DPMN_052801 [Dreissena polymorpha]|uniref:Uncharacterized protein n=1 Tax=Dreissena polymorpha TaxID=45954 RepID=A0A9D4HPN5_DREPO|nr:hypothetical protein DPMN_052801 [Dreissena polymorpha]
MDDWVGFVQNSNLEFTKPMNPKEIHSRSHLKRKKINESLKQSSKIENKTIMVRQTRQKVRPLGIPVPAKLTKRTNEENETKVFKVVIRRKTVEINLAYYEFHNDKQNILE